MRSILSLFEKVEVRVRLDNEDTSQAGGGGGRFGLRIPLTIRVPSPPRNYSQCEQMLSLRR